MKKKFTLEYKTEKEFETICEVLENRNYKWANSNHRNAKLVKRGYREGRYIFSDKENLEDKLLLKYETFNPSMPAIISLEEFIESDIGL